MHTCIHIWPSGPSTNALHVNVDPPYSFLIRIYKNTEMYRIRYYTTDMCVIDFDQVDPMETWHYLPYLPIISLIC